MKNIAPKGKEMKDSASLAPTNADWLEKYALKTTTQIARICNVSPRCISNWMKTRRIPYRKIGATVRFSVPEVMAALSRFTIEPITTR